MKELIFPIDRAMSLRLLRSIRQGYFTYSDLLAIYSPIQDQPADLSVLTNEELRAYHNMLCKIYHEVDSYLIEKTE